MTHIPDAELIAKLYEFTRWAIRECCFEELGDLSWDAVQDKALSLGLIVQHDATAENKDQWEEIEDVEEGDWFYTFCDELGPRRYKFGPVVQEAGTR